MGIAHSKDSSFCLQSEEDKRRSWIRSGAYVRRPCGNAARGKSAAGVGRRQRVRLAYREVHALAALLISDECRLGRLKLFETEL